MVELWQLCSDGDAEGVKAALEGGAGVNSRGGRGNYTCLMWAAYGQSEAVVSLLLEQPGIQVNARSQNNRTALHFACHYGSGRMVKRLLAEPGIDCNVRGVEGRTPLMVAVEADREEVVREMVAVQGVDITTRDAEGRSLEEVGRLLFGGWQPILDPFISGKMLQYYDCSRMPGRERRHVRRTF